MITIFEDSLEKFRAVKCSLTILQLISRRTDKLLTDGQKILPLSEPIEASLGLGETKPEVISSALK